MITAYETGRMSTYRPTTLQLANRHCPRAVDYYEERRQAFRDVYSVGIAAHAILDVLGQEGKRRALSEDTTVADRVAQQLMVAGRTFDGVAEPPLPPDAVLEGRDLALSWIARNPLSLTAEYELGLGFSASWSPTGYSHADADVRFRLIYDVVDRVDHEDEETAGSGVVVRDYKSAWPTGQGELDTIQMRAQAVCAWLRWPELDFVRQEVVNLRTGELFSRTLWYQQDQAVLQRWWRDLELAMEALDQMTAGARPARPGAGCMGCPWVLSCEAASQFVRDARLGGALAGGLDRATVARAFLVADAQRQALVALAKRATEEGAVDVGDGCLVGTAAQPGRAARADAGRLAWRVWQERGGDLDGFLRALGPGVTSLQGVARLLLPRKKAEQEQLLDQWTEPSPRTVFGLHQRPAGDEVGHG